ncbi:MAG: flagellar biosynthesis protein FlhA [Zetaproteobacteria bacterium]|nr:MAG: flagellar biosynthesis protein FlhA [Zetaproteobacteria bacterium]
MQAAATLAIQRFGRHTDVLLAIGVLGVLLIMMVPMPTWLMDVMLAANITLGIVILLTSIYVLKPLDFSVFPSLLLLTTLFRLALNVASTRLILLHGQEGPAAAGRVIEGFGQFVVGGNTVVGLILFLILVLINFIVITKGSTRIAEVAARFTLDAMPGKQMAIDADLNAGLIDDKTARSRREFIAREAEFYGAMDGASKFVRGDAIAGLVITAINIFAGLVIGTMQQGMPLSEAVDVYSILTVGDGLVSQIPALVISTAAGIIITRAGGEAALPQELSRQFTQNPRVHMVGSGALLLMALVPGLPFIPFLLLSVALGITAWYLHTTSDAEKGTSVTESDVTPMETKPDERLSELLVLDPIRLEVGYGLIDLVESGRDGNLLDRLQAVRRQITRDIGFVLPPVHIKDNLQLGVGDYRVLIRGAEIGRSEIRPRNLLALEGQQTGEQVEGVATQEPAFGLPALWIDNDKRQQAELSGYTVVEPATVIITHITELLRRHAHEILDRAQVRELLDGLSERYPKIVEDIVPAQVSLGLLQNVLQRLLAEWVPIRDLMVILETLADAGGEQRDVDVLTERVRTRLGRSIVQHHLDPQGELRVFALESELEQNMNDRAVAQSGATLPMDIQHWQRFTARLSDVVARHDVDTPVILTSPQLRHPLAKALNRIMPRIAVLSIAEVPPNITVHPLEQVGI